MSVKINGEEHQFLYEKITEAIDVGLELEDLDEEVINNLSQDKPLRYYQLEALKYSKHYIEKINKNKQINLLYYMATGSGKTIIMAAMILYFYKLGYNSFVFFVNNANIIEKTKDNFLNKSSSKYLFSEKIIIDGKSVEINEINNFTEIDKNKINIMFTTVQTLHENLKLIKENQLSLEDFEDNKVVLLADEAHHLNAEAKKKKTKADDEDIFSWEYTINQILLSNKESVLLEFTATPDFRNENIVRKYIDKVIYNYDLLNFRKDGFTKDFDNYQTSYDPIHRLLLALLISQYRRKLFAKNRINAKPVVLGKCKTTDERVVFVEKFNDFLQNKIKESDISMFEENAEGYVKRMFAFYKDNNISYKNLIDELKIEFSLDNIIELDSSMNTLELQEKNMIVNSLENINNPIRLVFVVNMLNEGWDVLNLYDIVRLYEDRDSGSKIGKSTIQEAQLIGRGVRYYPFYTNEQEKEIYNKRKYDNNLDSEMRICETLLFHSKTDSKYLYELREALKQQGLDVEDKTVFEYNLKESFLLSDVYKDGVLYTNTQQNIKNVNDKVPTNFKFILNRNFSHNDIQTSLADENITFDENKNTTYTTNLVIKDYAKNNYSIVYKAMRKNFLPFNILKKYIPSVKSNKDFIFNEDYIGNFQLFITSDKEYPTSEECYSSLLDFFYKLRRKFESWKETTVGTHEFQEVKISNIIKNTRREKIHPDLYGEGISQNSPNMLEKYKLDLSKYDWYVYNDNYGTTEEKSFVKFFSSIVDDIKKEYDEVYLIRNERNLHIYSFDEGGRFEPDYLLILKNNKTGNSYEQKQIFIEPKGDHLLFVDNWKEKFLKEIKEESILEIYKFRSNNEYYIYGMPFYNENNTIDEFKECLQNAIADKNVNKNVIINDYSN